ncbi:hypothetical protein HDR63_00110 [bacterium]|nr:hypothetical protein [bacterium]
MTTEKKSFKGAYDRATLAQKLDKYRPRNMPAEAFALSPDLEYVVGPFSTFDGRLAQMIRNGAPQQMIQDYIINALPNLQTVAMQYATDTMAAADDMRPLCDMIRHNGAQMPKMMLTTFFQQMAQIMNQRMDISNPVPTVVVVDSWNELPPVFAALPSSESDIVLGRHATGLRNDGSPINVIIINRGNIVKHVGPRGDIYTWLMITFAHEFSHYVDTVAPHRGALGAQATALHNEDVMEHSAHSIDQVVQRVMSGRNDGK